MNKIQTGRLISLDVFRGLTIAGMILVNTPGSWKYVYSPLQHAEWHGCTPTDLVFPFFLFIVGVSIVLAFAKSQEKGATPAQLWTKILKRTFLLLLIGWLLHLYPKFDISHLRLPGVLQRIALVFFFCAVIYLTVPLRWQYFLAAFLLLLYWVLMMFVPVPNGLPANVDMPTQFDSPTNLSAWLDYTLLKGFLYSRTKVYDPEGILSTMPAIVTGMLGMFTGYFLQSSFTAIQKVQRMLLAGLLCLAMGLLWSLHFPINKQLWTSSYVLYTAGYALLFLALCYYLIDIRKIQNGLTHFFIIFGSNAITAYAISGIFIKTFWLIKIGDLNLQSWSYQYLFESWLQTYNASLAWGIAYVLLCFLPVWWMYRNKIFLKV